MVDAIETSSASEGPNLEASELKLRIVPASDRNPPFVRPRSCVCSGFGCCLLERMYLTAKTASRAKLRTDNTTAIIVPTVLRPVAEAALAELEDARMAPSAVKPDAIAARFGAAKEGIMIKHFNNNHRFYQNSITWTTTRILF